ncbi:MAG: hypothetical protein R6U58_00985 [Bacteroidales bacterium]
MISYLKKKWLFTAVVLISIIISRISYGQNDNSYFEKYFYGGYIGIDLGVINQFEGSPIAGYRITSWWQTGLGGKYLYYYDKRMGNVFRAHLFGPLIFTDFIPVHNLNDLLPFRFLEAGLVLHAEMDLFNLPVEYFDAKNEYPGRKRFFRPSWITGIGLQREAGPDRYLNIMLLFDVSGHSPKIYSNAFVRFGFIF